MLSTIARACGGRGLVYFCGGAIGCVASARWSASAVGMLGVVLAGGLGMGEECGSSAFGWEKESGGGRVASPPPPGIGVVALVAG